MKPGTVSREHGEFYDEIYEARQRGDYIELIRFEKDQIEAWLQKARQFNKAIKSLILS